MVRKTLFEGKDPKTQSIEAVKQLIAYHHHGQEPAEMPPFYRLSGEMVLVLSNKEDAYYVVAHKACSCPSATYHPGQACKHQRKYFPQPMRTLKLADEIRPAGKWPGGMNGPVTSRRWSEMGSISKRFNALITWAEPQGAQDGQLAALVLRGIWPISRGRLIRNPGVRRGPYHGGGLRWPPYSGSSWPICSRS